MMTGTYRLDVSWRGVAVHKRSPSSVNQQVKVGENAEERGTSTTDSAFYCLLPLYELFKLAN